MSKPIHCIDRAEFDASLLFSVLLQSNLTASRTVFRCFEHSRPFALACIKTACTSVSVEILLQTLLVPKSYCPSSSFTNHSFIILIDRSRFIWNIVVQKFSITMVLLGNKRWHYSKQFDNEIAERHEILLLKKYSI